MSEPDLFDLARQAAAHSLNAFTQFCRKDFELARHHHVVNDHLEALWRGDILKLAIFEHPRSSKSSQVSQIFPAWAMQKRPVKFTVGTYGHELSLVHGRACKNIIESETYTKLFPWAKVAEDSASNTRFHLKNGSAYRALGVGGAWTGTDFDFGVIDDPIKNLRQALSIDFQKNLLNWYRTEFYTRRLSKRSRICLVQTLWSENDLGLALPEHDKDWTVLKVPAINDKGEAMWPERFPVDELLNIKANIGSYAFEALYQQNPSPIEGNIVKRNWIRVVSQIPQALTNLTISVDTAVHGGDHNDRTSMSVYGQLGRDHYRIEGDKGRWEFPQTVAHFRNFCAKHRTAGLKLIEDTANGAALASHCSDIPGIKLIKPRGDKTSRLVKVSPTMEAGNFYVVESYDSEDFIEEVVGFPTAKHDDQVDELTQYLDHAMTRYQPKFVSNA